MARELLPNPAGAAISSRLQAIQKALQPTTRTLCRIACSSGWCASARRASRSAESTSRATASTTRNLISALLSSSSDLAENIRFSPDSGLSRLNLGCRASIENSQPPRAIGPTIAATSSISRIGQSPWAAR